VRALLKQFGERKIADDVSSAWQGGAYVTFHRKDKPATSTSTADLALLYVSRWKNPQAAERFARFYTSAVAQRYHSAAPQAAPACSGSKCPVASAEIVTEEGPVIVEQWADNSVVVSESFDANTAAKVQNAVRDRADGAHAQAYPEGELGLRLYKIPAFRVFADRIGAAIEREMLPAPTR
jgi:hypothetical protein